MLILSYNEQMIVSKQISQNEVTSVRLTTGEELVGRFVSQDDTTITLNKVISIQLVPMGNGQAGISLAPFMASVPDDGQQTFFKTALVCLPQKTRKEVADRYLEATGSIIPAAPAQIPGLLKP